VRGGDDAISPYIGCQNCRERKLARRDDARIERQTHADPSTIRTAEQTATWTAPEFSDTPHNEYKNARRS
jgi:hypothetical protein